MASKLLCFNCKHYNRGKDNATCEAFPEGIPEEIFLGDNPHSEPLKEQKNNIVFEPMQN